MNSVIVLLLTFMMIGLGSTRLGKRSYFAMGVAIIVYVVYAYRS